MAKGKRKSPAPTEAWERPAQTEDELAGVEPWKQPKSQRNLRGKALGPLDKESILQTYALTGSIVDTARRLGLAYTTVRRVIRLAEASNELTEARQMVAQELAAKVHEKTLECLQHITPDDMRTDRVEKRDADGNLLSVSFYGPSLLQKVTAMAILVDKEKAIAEYQAMLGSASGAQQGLPLPADIAGMVEAIKGRISRLRMLDVQFDAKQPDLAARVQEATMRSEFTDTPAEVDNVDVPAAGTDPAYPFDAGR